MTTPRDSQRSKFLRAYYTAKTDHPATFTNPQFSHWVEKLKRKVRAYGRTVQGHPHVTDRWALIYYLSVTSAPDDEAPHGRDSARLMIQLVQNCIGKDAAKTLKEAFQHEGVKYRAAPKLSDAERERRKQQGQALAGRKAEEMLAEHREKIKQRLGIN